MEISTPTFNKLALLVPRALYHGLPLSLAAHSWHRRHRGFEGVGFAGKVTFAFIFDERDVSAADDVGCLCELDVRGAIPEPIYAQAGEGDEIFLFSSRGKGNGEYRMPDLLDND